MQRLLTRDDPPGIPAKFGFGTDIISLGLSAVEPTVECIKLSAKMARKGNLRSRSQFRWIIHISSTLI